MAKKTTANLPPKLTEIEQDLLSHIQDGYQLETDSLGGNLVLRRLKDNEEIRPLSANRNTIKAMDQRGLISPGKGRPAHYRVASEKENKLGQGALMARTPPSAQGIGALSPSVTMVRFRAGVRSNWGTT